MAPSAPFKVVRAAAYNALIASTSEHEQLEVDLKWVEGRIAQAPTSIGDHVPKLKGFSLPIYKTRVKDSCCKISARSAWRVYYAVDDAKKLVHMLFFHHKNEVENP